MKSSGMVSEAWFYLENNKINIYSIKGNERTAFYPELHVLLDVFKNQKEYLTENLLYWMMKAFLLFIIALSEKQ